MKQTGGIKDYSEKRAQSIINHYYEMSYPDRRNIGRAEMLTKIKITIPTWLRTLERLLVHIKEMDELQEKEKATQLVVNGIQNQEQKLADAVFLHFSPLRLRQFHYLEWRASCVPKVHATLSLKTT